MDRLRIAVLLDMILWMDIRKMLRFGHAVDSGSPSALIFAKPLFPHIVTPHTTRQLRRGNANLATSPLALVMRKSRG